MNYDYNFTQIVKNWNLNIIFGFYMFLTSRKWIQHACHQLLFSSVELFKIIIVFVTIL
uniref:Uncharacterized protein n=1 Tax=Kalanchoe fedtschenkoi TaxID=63787 RepID=A0A7N0UWL7_KALFE